MAANPVRRRCRRQPPARCPAHRPWAPGSAVARYREAHRASSRYHLTSESGRREGARDGDDGAAGAHGRCGDFLFRNRAHRLACRQDLPQGRVSVMARRARGRAGRQPAVVVVRRRGRLAGIRGGTAMTRAFAALLLNVLIPGSAIAAPTPCASLTTLRLPNATITLAQAVDAGPFTPPSGAAQGRSGEDSAAVLRRTLPAFCRVTATLMPTRDSDIKIEVWLPAAGWNGKYQAVGNGAFSGSIAYAAMMNALARGYATSSTDTGHTGNNAAFAPGHPEKVIDFGWRAVHEMVVASKRIVAAFYEEGAKFSYWSGCSAGGRQAMMEAQRFPADFDGIIAGAPGLDWTGRAAQAVRVMKALDANEAARLPPALAQLLHRTAVATCDAQDGVQDGLIADPSRCRFDPSVLQCGTGLARQSAEAATAASLCLSPAQVETAKLIYSPLINPKTKREIAGLAPGSELGWTATGWTASARATGLDQFRFLVFNDAAWTAQRFSVDSDLARAEDEDGGVINAFDANLKPFLDRG